MKMITAIINKKDSNQVCKVLTENGFIYTKIATVGGFLKSGNTTIIMGVDDDKLEKALNIIRKNSAKRTEYLPAMPLTERNNIMLDSHPLEIEVGGATIFVTNVEHFEKIW